MKKLSLCAFILAITLAGCSDDQEESQPDVTPIPNKPATQAASEPEASASVGESNHFTEFSINSIPVSGKSLGTFPYFDSPNGYAYATAKERPSEEKYFFSSDGKLIRVKGKYFIGYLEPKPNFEEATSMVVQNYDQAITAAGGVKIFEGSAPEALRSEYSMSAPPGYWRDMYNPLAARFMQYVINQGNGSVWVELAVNPGTNRIDLTVIQQGSTEVAPAPTAQASAPATTASAPQ